MTPEERQLIGDLFERMRSTGLGEKDRDAEAFINQSVRATPDAAYKMVQSVLVQENALQEAGYRIEDLEARVRELEDHINQAQSQQRPGSGGFLGGLFGGGKPQQRESSVPAIGQRPQQSSPGGSPWGQQRGPQGGYGQPQGGYGQPQGGYGQPQPQQAAGGGFMRSAMTTAAGVAGGMLAAGAIRDMMNSGGAKAQAAEQNQSASTPEASPYEVASEEPSSSYDSNDSDSGWDSGGDGDSDI